MYFGVIGNFTIALRGSKAKHMSMASQKYALTASGDLHQKG